MNNDPKTKLKRWLFATVLKNSTQPQYYGHIVPYLKPLCQHSDVLPTGGAVATLSRGDPLAYSLNICYTKLCTPYYKVSGLWLLPPAKGLCVMSSPAPVLSSSSRVMALVLLGLVGLSLVIGVLQLLKPSASLSEQSQAIEAKGQNTVNATKILANISAPHLVRLDLEGAISATEDKKTLFNDKSPAEQAVETLNAVAKDDKVKGVLLVINSPGGTVGMSQELYAAVLRVRKHKPVVTSMGDIAASGGYYTAVASDKIYANAGTLTASIGVIINNINAKTLLNDKLGVRANVFKSGQFKDILSPFRDTTPAEANLIQTLINDSYQDFLGAVLAGRLPHYAKGAERDRMEQTIRSVADGRIVLGSQALKAGLVDELGDLYAAEEGLRTLARERFNMGDKAELPLKNHDSPTDFFSLMGFGLSGQWASQLSNTTEASVTQALLPMSVRYSNQPLWLYE